MEEVAGTVTVEVPGRGRGVSEHSFSYQVPVCPAPTHLQAGLSSCCCQSIGLCLPASTPPASFPPYLPQAPSVPLFLTLHLSALPSPIP